MFNINFKKERISGYEGVLPQTDLYFVNEIDIILSTLLSEVEAIYVKNENMSSEVISNVKQKFKDISKILSKRFNINIHIVNSMDTEKGLVYSILPDLSYDNIFKVINKANKIPYSLFSTNSTKVRDAMLISANEFATAIKDNYVEIDYKEAKIYGVDNVSMYTYINIELAVKNNLTATELISIILKEIGMFFSGIEMMHISTSISKPLVDSMLEYSNNASIDTVKIISQRSFNKNIKSTEALDVLVEFNTNYINTYKDKLEDEFNLGQQSIVFINKFNLGEHYLSVVSKQNNEALFKYKSLDIVSTVFKVVLMAILAFVSMMFMVVFGPALLMYLAIHAIVLIAMVFVKLTINAIFFLLNKTIVSNNKDDNNLLNVLNTITLLKNDSIRQYRTMDAEHKQKLLSSIKRYDVLLEGIDNVLHYKNNLRAKEKLTPNINSMIESLENTSLHYLHDVLRS